MKWLALTLVLAGCSTDTFIGPDGSTGDAGGDARDESMGGDACAPTPGTCLPNAQCNTFDDATPSLGPFVNISQNGGNVSFVSDFVVTCPHALAASVPASGASGSPPRGAIGGSSTLNVPSVTAHAHVELDVILPKTPTGPATFVFMYPNSDTAGGIGLVWNGSGWVVYDGVTTDQAPITPRTDAWNHVALDVTFASSGGAGKIGFAYIDSNGKPQTATMSTSTLSGTIQAITSITFGAGVTPGGVTSAPMTMHIDDVVFSPF